MNYSVAGPFSAFDVGDGAWQLSGDTPASVRILLRGASARPAQLFAVPPRIERVALEWSLDVVIVTLTFAGGSTALTAHSALVHEPQLTLYRCLPLADFDANARVFWKRVFRLMRIPGGRLVLGWMNRRGRRDR